MSYIPVEASYLFGTFLVRTGLDVTAEGSGKPGDTLDDEGSTRDCWPGRDDICCHGIPQKCFIFGGLPRPLFVGAGGNGVDWRKSGWSADDSAGADGVIGGDGLTSGCWSAEDSAEADRVNDGDDGLTDG